MRPVVPALFAGLGLVPVRYLLLGLWRPDAPGAPADEERADAATCPAPGRDAPFLAALRRAAAEEADEDVAEDAAEDVGEEGGAAAEEEVGEEGAAIEADEEREDEEPASGMLWARPALDVALSLLLGYIQVRRKRAPSSPTPPPTPARPVARHAATQTAADFAERAARDAARLRLTKSRQQAAQETADAVARAAELRALARGYWEEGARLRAERAEIGLRAAAVGEEGARVDEITEAKAGRLLQLVSEVSRGREVAREAVAEAARLEAALAAEGRAMSSRVAAAASLNALVQRRQEQAAEWEECRAEAAAAAERARADDPRLEELERRLEDFGGSMDAGGSLTHEDLERRLEDMGCSLDAGGSVEAESLDDGAVSSPAGSARPELCSPRAHDDAVEAPPPASIACRALPLRRAVPSSPAGARPSLPPVAAPSARRFGDGVAVAGPENARSKADSVDGGVAPSPEGHARPTSCSPRACDDVSEAPPPAPAASIACRALPFGRVVPSSPAGARPAAPPVALPAAGQPRRFGDGAGPERSPSADKAPAEAPRSASDQMREKMERRRAKIEGGGAPPGAEVVKPAPPAAALPAEAIKPMPPPSAALPAEAIKPAPPATAASPAEAAAAISGDAAADEARKAEGGMGPEHFCLYRSATPGRDPLPEDKISPSPPSLTSHKGGGAQHFCIYTGRQRQDGGNSEDAENYDDEDSDASPSLTGSVSPFTPPLKATPPRVAKPLQLPSLDLSEAMQKGY